MAQIRVYIQPRFPAASSQTAFYDFSSHIEFDTLQWEQNDQGNASTLQANIYTIMPVSTTHWNSYTGATEADRIQAALNDQFFRLKIYPRTEIQVRDVSTSPHTILWGGVVTRVSEQRDGGAITGSIEAVDYTALLNESVALEFTPLGNSTIKQTITSSTYTLTPSLAERTAGLAQLTVSSIAIGSPYSRDLQIGDTIVVNLSTVGGVSDDTFDGVHKITGITTASGGTYKIRFKQFSNVADVSSGAAVGSVSIPGFMTTANAPQLDSRIRVLSANITDLNPDWKWSPRNPDISRAVSTAARSGTTATITTSSPHGFGVDGVVTVTLSNGPTGYADLNGSYVITDTPTDSTFTYTTLTSGTITSGAATGTAVAAGEITPTPLKGGTIARNLQYAVEKGTGCFYLNQGTLDVSNNLTIDLFVRRKELNDLISNGLFDGGSTTGWAIGSFSVDSVGNTGPFGIGNSVYYTGSDHQDAELSSGSRIDVVAGEKYFVSWRQKSAKTNKSHLHVKFYNSGGTVVGNSHGYDICKTDLPNDEWGRNYGIIVVPTNATKMTPVLHHDSFSSSYSVYYTDIQVVKLTGSFGFSDRPQEDNTWYNSIGATGVDLRDFENPSAPEEAGESSNRIYVYAPYTTEDTLTGAKQLTSYRNTYDFVQGVWEAGGKRIEGSIVELNATDSATALLTAQKFFSDRGQSLRSYEFEHTSGALNVGDVVPFIWNELGVAEALVVRKQVGYLIGQDVYYRVQLGGDLAFQRSTMYLVEQRLREISGDAAYFSPPPSPYPGFPTQGGIVTPAKPSGDAGALKVDLAWDYPQSIVNSPSFGGFIVLRSDDAGSTWVKASTQEPISTAENPLAPDTSVPSYTDTTVSASVGYTYKIAAVDVSTPTRILTEYSTTTATLTPTDVGTVDFATPYVDYGINVPKVVNSVTYPGNGSAKTISTITSGASTTATVTTSAVHGFSTGYVVGITGAVGTNSGDVNGGFYVITVTSTTAFTITKTGTNVLSLTGGTATGWQVSGDFNANVPFPSGTATALTLPQTEYPIGQVVYSSADGKLYRNGKPGTTAFDNKWTRAAVDAIDVTTDGSIIISADRITSGSIDAGVITVTNLNASNITSGTLTSRAINNGSGTFQVTSGGDLTATSASITGAITATSGTIAGWTVETVGTDRLYAGSGSSFVGLSTGSTAIFAGATSNTGSSAKFSVTAAGSVSASDIAITGGSITGTTLDLASGAFTVGLAGGLGGRMYAKSGWFEPSGSTYPAIVVQAAGTYGDIAAANDGTLQFGGTTLTDQNDLTGAFISRMTISSTLVNSKLPVLIDGNLELNVNGAEAFTLDGYIALNRGAAGNTAMQVKVAGDAVNRFLFQVDGNMAWGDGTNARDTNLYRSAANILTTDDTFDCLALTTGNITATSLFTGTNINLTGANGYRHDAPATTTATTNAAIWVLVSGTNYQIRRNSSSARYKTNIVDADNIVLESARQIKPRHYESTITDEAGVTRLGFIAEEIHNAGLTHAVGYDSEGRPETIDSVALIAALWHRVNDLESRVAELEA